MSVKFTNNGKTTLSASVAASDTSISVSDASVLPSISGSEYFYLTLQDTSGNLEVVKVTAVSSNTLTVTRAQEGTTAIAFASGDKAENRLTAGGLNDVSTQADTNTDTTYTAGSGLSLSGTEFSNSAPDQTVSLTGSGATSVSGTYPNFTISSTDTDTNTTYSVGDGGLTEKNFTTALKGKLDGIESGAEVNVNADWNASSGDAQILNKPSIPSLSGYATETYVDTAVSDLVDSAPSTLDTLNELAAALGDDANFSTTVTNSIATKLPLAGGTLTGALTGTTASFATSSTTNYVLRLEDTGAVSYDFKFPDTSIIRLETHASADKTFKIENTAGGNFDLDVVGTVSMLNGHATGKFAVKSTGVHPSYDFYNNGTSYFNSAVTVDDNLYLTAGKKLVLPSAHTKQKIEGYGGGSEWIGTSANQLEFSGGSINFNGAQGTGTANFKMGGTTVIDSSRNLSNIGTADFNSHVNIGTFSTTGTGSLY